jgi:hypothetical protein
VTDNSDFEHWDGGAILILLMLGVVGVLYLFNYLLRGGFW